ncbi:hypothetical protein [Rhizobium sp. 22-785-1]
MYTYRNSRPYVNVYADPTSDKAIEVLTTGVYTFIGDGTSINNRLKVYREGQTPALWIEEAALRRLDPGELNVELQPISLVDFYRDASRAAQIVTEYRQAGGMSVEYLLLLAWVESRWSNTDSGNNTVSPLNLPGPIGPFRFAPEVWKSLLNDGDYSELLRGFTEADRLIPKYQPIFAAILANKIQFNLKLKLGMIDPPAWLLALGHRIGIDALLRFAVLDDGAAVSDTIDGVQAISTEIISSDEALFPQGAATSKATVREAVLLQLFHAKQPVIEKLGALIDEFKLTMATQSEFPYREGVLGFLDFIGKYEAAGNYNAVYGRSDNVDNPRLVEMTIAEVLSFQRDHMGDHSPCGKYQIVRRTLQAAYQYAGLKEDDLFDDQAQDLIGDYLLMTVRGGKAFLQNPDKNYEEFTVGVAQEWAALPVLRQLQGSNRVVQRGETYYAGDGVNLAGASPELLEAAVRKLLAET